MTAAPAGRTALYRLFGAGDRLLYVGISTQPETRWTQHAADKPWWPLVLSRKVEWHPTRKEAEAAERTAVDAEEPLYNTAGAKRSLLASHFPIGSSLPQAQARLRLTDVLDSTQFHGQAVEITRHGKPAGVLMSPDGYDAAVAALAESRELKRRIAAAQEPSDG
ncbi:type II toxin-antitoxin system prevent-host-death family antitoxin [Streptomyces sp. NPDC055817]